MIRSNAIVFMHGAFVTSRCWDSWVGFFEARGYECIAPLWLHKHGEARVLRGTHPDPNIAALVLREVINHHESIVRSLPVKPILVGHSIGGLLVQLLLQKGLGEAGIAIHSAPLSMAPHSLTFLS